MTGFIGAGKMAEALLAGLLRRGVCLPQDIGVCDVQVSRGEALHASYGVHVFGSNTELAEACEPVVLAVKPQDLDPVLQEIRAHVCDRLVISIAAGRMLAGLEDALPAARVVRVMPNLPCQVGEGMSVICGGTFATSDDLVEVENLCRASGCVCFAEEPLFDIVTAVSGSGPAFWAQLAQYQVEKAVADGMPAEAARLLVLQTMLGTAKVLLEGDQEFSLFMDAVASKGGTTAAGLNVLRQSDAGQVLANVLEAAAARSRALRG
jgi:pyrroline-5-carboxylate reductase